MEIVFTSQDICEDQNNSVNVTSPIPDSIWQTVECCFSCFPLLRDALWYRGKIRGKGNGFKSHSQCQHQREQVHTLWVSVICAVWTWLPRELLWAGKELMCVWMPATSWSSRVLLIQHFNKRQLSAHYGPGIVLEKRIQARGKKVTELLCSLGSSGTSLWVDEIWAEWGESHKNMEGKRHRGRGKGEAKGQGTGACRAWLRNSRSSRDCGAGSRKGWASEATRGPLTCTLQTTKRTFYLVLSTRKPWEGFKEGVWRRECSNSRAEAGKRPEVTAVSAQSRDHGAAARAGAVEAEMFWWNVLFEVRANKICWWIDCGEG